MEEHSLELAVLSYTQDYIDKNLDISALIRNRCGQSEDIISIDDVYEDYIRLVDKYIDTISDDLVNDFSTQLPLDACLAFCADYMKDWKANISRWVYNYMLRNELRKIIIYPKIKDAAYTLRICIAEYIGDFTILIGSAQKTIEGIDFSFMGKVATGHRNILQELPKGGALLG